MKFAAPLFTLLFLLLSYAISAQVTIVDSTQYAESDFSRRAQESRTALDNSLSTGRSYFIDAPPVEYDADPEKLYYNPAFKAATIQLLGEESFSTLARYQLLNQKFEVVADRKVFDLDNERILSIDILNDHFILLFDPLRRQRGRVIHQVHFHQDGIQLLEQHQAEWRQQQRGAVAYGKIENKQLLNRYNIVILAIGEKAYQIKSAKDLTTALNLPKKGAARNFIKAEKLKLNKPADAARLLEYLADNDLL